VDRCVHPDQAASVNSIDLEVALLAPLVNSQLLLARAAESVRSTAVPERGQGTVEYVALVTLVAIVMVGVIAALKSAQFAEGQELGAMILKKITEAVSKVKY
jgi:Flp pilus assembly pilin Flp